MLKVLKVVVRAVRGERGLWRRREGRGDIVEVAEGLRFEAGRARRGDCDTNGVFRLRCQLEVAVRES